MRVRHWIIAALCLAGVSMRAEAGKNAGGYLVFYTNDSVTYTPDNEPYTSSGQTCPLDPQCPPYDGDNCSARKAIVESANSSAKTNDTVVFWLFAGWPEETCCKLKALQFGITYDPVKMYINSYGAISDFELTTAYQQQDWPAPGSGTALTWNSAKTSHLTEVYWFTAYVYDQATEFQITNHPTQDEPVFGDDDIPAGLDPVGVGYDPNNPLVGFLPSLGLAGAAGNNGDVTATKTTTWGGIKSRYQQD